jgi:glycosyltransferase involved in cell wall biosynthesis
MTHPKIVTTLPPVTLILYAYNEEAFISEAIRSVLAQDYPNLEVVLSDDGSTDLTFEIMQEAARNYHGPHGVKLNHNLTNLGIGSQLNAAVAMTNADLILLANGDDICEPDRVRRTAEAWIANDHPTAVWSDLTQIDAEGRPSGRIIDQSLNAPSLTGGMRARFSGPGAASLALRRDVFSRFGPLPDNLILEDVPLLMRAMLLGKGVHMDVPVVRYRVHDDNISQSFFFAAIGEWRVRNRTRAIWQKGEAVKAYLQMLRDLYQKPAESWPERDLKHARWIGMEKLMENSILHDYYAEDDTVSLRERLGTMARLAVLLLKVEIKRMLPFIERRSERWHHDRVRSIAANRDA